VFVTRFVFFVSVIVRRNGLTQHRTAPGSCCFCVVDVVVVIIVVVVVVFVFVFVAVVVVLVGSRVVVDLFVVDLFVVVIVVVVAVAVGVIGNGIVHLQSKIVLLNYFCLDSVLARFVVP
jgi:hypothetical protein